MCDEIATYVLVFMVVGINSHIKMSIGYVGTKTATAGELYPLMWKAVAYLEIVCGLKVCIIKAFRLKCLYGFVDVFFTFFFFFFFFFTFCGFRMITRDWIVVLT